MYDSATAATKEDIKAPPFAAWLKERRKARDLTQEELADRVGCSRDHIRKIELGQRRPSRQVAELLAADLGVPPADWPAFVHWARTAGMGLLPALDAPDFSLSENRGPDQGTLLRSPGLDDGAETIASPVNPYKGLRPFFESDAPDFFGREALVDQLLSRLNEQTEFSRFLAVVGSSGSGKSSAVRAGLIPRLRAAGLPGGLSPIFADARPGTYPSREVRAALLRSVSAVDAPAGGRRDPQLSLDGEQDWLQTAAQLFARREGTGLFLLIDQFEEVFTLAADEATRAAFLKEIYSAVAGSCVSNRLWVVVTLRADFYDRPLAYPGISQLLGKRTEVVTPLTLAEIRSAILRPAERAGLELEASLVAAIERDVGEQPGRLPLMEYALTELFEQRTGLLLTLQAYEASGGVTSALGRRAEAIYAGLTAAEQREAKQIFLRLVAVGQGADDTRRRVLRSELVSAASDEVALDQILDLFGEHRLLSFDRDPRNGRPTVEVAHEALFTAWARLREWLDAGNADLQVHRRLMSAASDWDEAGRDAGFLARGGRLGQFEALAAESDLALTAGEAAYLHTSVAARERDRVERERRQRLTRFGLAFGLALTSLLALLAVVQSFQANEQRDNALASADARATAQALAELKSKDAQEQQQLAFSRELAARSLAQLHINPTLSLLLGIQAANLSLSAESEDALRRALVETQPHTELRYPGNEEMGAAIFSPDGGEVATTGDGVTVVWAVNDRTGTSGNVVGRLITPRRPANHASLWEPSVAFSPNGKQLAVASDDGIARVWDLDRAPMVAELVGHTNIVNDVAFSPDGRLVATASNDKTARVWEATSGRPVLELAGHTARVNSVAFSPDGKHLVTAGADATAIIWDASTGRPLITLSGQTGPVNSAAYNPDGTQIVTAGNDGVARIWSASTGKTLLELQGHTAPVKCATFSPDGRMVITGSADNTALIWDASTGEVLAKIEGSIIETGPAASDTAAQIYAATFSPDSKRVLLLTTPDQAARIYSWNIFVPAQQLLSLAPKLAPREFTCEERQIYLHRAGACPTPTPRPAR